jgi:hypothetical protein
LITLTDGLYTPKGNVRLSFVDHGADLSKEGAQSLADKVKILQQTYGTDSFHSLFPWFWCHQG